MVSLGGGFKDFFCSSLFGEDEPHFDEYFPKGLVQPPTSSIFLVLFFGKVFAKFR